MATPAQISDITVGSYHIDIRVEQVDSSGIGYFVRNDLTPYFIQEGGQIERDNCAASDHATARLTFAFTDDDVIRLFGQPDIPWSSMRLRPAMRLVSHDGLGTSDWCNLGVFLPETPTRRADQQPKVYDVDCHDVVSTLESTTAGTVLIAGGRTVQEAIEGLFALESPDSPLNLVPNIPRRFPRSISGAVPSDRQWVIDEDITWLLIMDQLLEMVGWRPLWVDQDGFVTSDLWIDPRALPVDLFLDDLPGESVVTIGSSNKLDTFGVPNHWVFIRSDFDPVASEAPAPGAGIEIRENLDTGPSSQLVRQRIVSSVQRVDVADQEALRLYADRTVLHDTIPSRTLCVQVSPQPIPWHRGVVDVTVRDLGIVGEKHLISSWTLPLDGADASLVMEGI